MPTTILVIDDERPIVGLLNKHLTAEGFQVLTASDGKSGIALAQTQMPELVILDRMMPDLNGLEVCRILKKDERTKFIAILMLSGKAEIEDRLSGMETGADDYLRKPVDLKELTARVHLLIRQKNRKSDSELTYTRCGNLEIDWARYRVKMSGKQVALSPKEFKILQALIEAKGRVLSRQRLLEQVWGYSENLNLTTRTLDQHISHLRKKLGKESSRIRAVKDVGYSFEFEEEEIE